MAKKSNSNHKWNKDVNVNATSQQNDIHMES